MKKLIFMRGSYRRIKDFPDEARREAGHQLWMIQMGREPDDWRPMQAVGAGVREIRIHHPHEHRVIYVAQFTEAIFVLHAFEKKTQQTPQNDIDLARAAYANIKRKSEENSREKQADEK